MNAPEHDDAGKPFVKVDWNIKHIRMLYHAVDFYLENRVQLLKPEEEIKEPTEDVYDMKRLLQKMILEFQYHTSDSV